MDYRRYVASSKTEFKVNDHLIECGHTTWQIRNIAATSLGRKVVPFHEPEPKFETPEPTLDIEWKVLLIGSVAVWLIVKYILNSPIFAILAAIGISVGLIYLAIEKQKISKVNWNITKAAILKKWVIWNEMRLNPPILFSLMLETNAGSKPLFYSFSEKEILKTKDAIKSAMEKKETAGISFQIETVNVGAEESINNFGSSIYQQSIQGA